MKLNSNRQAFLDMIAFSEIGPGLLAVSDRGYNVLVGSTPAHPLLFTDYSKHPRIRNEKLNSDAAGRYQFLGRYWEYYKKFLKLTDFGPSSQDRWGLQLVKECKAMADVDAGEIETAIYKCRSRWASFPGSGYGQPENTKEVLLAAFEKAKNTA